MSNFMFTIPGENYIGPGTANNVGELAKLYGSKVFLCIDPFLAKNDTGEKILKLLDRAELEVITFSKIKPNPDCREVDAGAKLCKSEKCELVVAVGGGSAMDTGKAIAMLALNPGNSWEYIARTDREYRSFDKTLPVIAIPTTAGTGSEVTHYSVISNPELKEKGCIHNSAMVPEVSLVDPCLMVSKPATLTAHTGIDALCHSLESFLNVHATPFSDLIAKESIRLVARYLPEAVANGRNIKAREMMALASTLGGVAIARAGTILPHGLGQPVSGLTDMPHGASMAASLGYIMEIAYTSNLEKFAELADCLALGDENAGLGLYTKAEKSVSLVHRLLKDTKCTVRFGDYGLTESDLDKAADIAIKGYAFDLDNSPLKVTKNDIIDIYRHCL